VTFRRFSDAKKNVTDRRDHQVDGLRQDALAAAVGVFCGDRNRPVAGGYPW